MNDKVQVPLHLGVDRHNRSPLGEGHPMLRATRNLLLGDKNELVRRKAMEFRQTIVRSNQDSGGLITQIGAGTEDGAVGGTGCKEPLALWLPPFPGSPATGSLGRPVVAVFVGGDGKYYLLADGEAYVVPLPNTGRRPQAVMWRGSLWVACGDAVPSPTSSTITNPPTGLVHARMYTNAAGVHVWGLYAGMGADIASNWFGVINDPAPSKGYKTFAAGLRPKVIGTFRDRMIVGNFPPDQYGNDRSNGLLISDYLPGTRVDTMATLPALDNIDVPRFGVSEVDPLTTRLRSVGEVGDPLVAVKELSLQQSGAMNQSALICLNDRSVYLMTGEPLSTADLGDMWAEAPMVKQPIEDGCASAETVCETPFGVIWAGHEDVYFMPNGGGAPTPIGRRIASEFLHTPFDMKWRWHAAYHEGYYRLFIMAPGQRQDMPVGMEACWCLDLRYGPPADWTQARWFGPQVYQPIGAVNGAADDIYRGVFCTAVEKRTAYKKELFCVQAGKDGEVDNFAWVLCGLDGEETRDWALPFSPTMYRTAGVQEALSANESRIVSAAGWLHGRQKKVTVAGTSAAGDPAWANDDSSNTTDGGVTWGPGGKVAVPGTWQTLNLNDGEDAFPSSRGNEILAGIRLMDLPANELNRDVSLRAVEMGVTRMDSTTWAIAPTRDGLHAGSLLKPVNAIGNMRLGNALNTRINDPIAPFTFWADVGYGVQTIGKHVAAMLVEYPYFTVRSDALKFSFYFDANNDNSPELLVAANLALSTLGALFVSQGVNTLYFNPRSNGLAGQGLYDSICEAMNAALTAGSLPGTFTHNMTNNPATCPVKPTITHSSREWTPNSYTTNYESAQSGDSAALWLELGFDPVSPGIVDSNFAAAHTAANSSWATKVPKLRIANLAVITRSFRRQP